MASLLVLACFISSSLPTEREEDESNLIASRFTSLVPSTTRYSQETLLRACHYRIQEAELSRLLPLLAQVQAVEARLAQAPSIMDALVGDRTFFYAQSELINQSMNVGMAKIAQILPRQAAETADLDQMATRLEQLRTDQRLAECFQKKNLLMSPEEAVKFIQEDLGGRFFDELGLDRQLSLEDLIKHLKVDSSDHSHAIKLRDDCQALISWKNYLNPFSIQQVRRQWPLRMELFKFLRFARTNLISWMSILRKWIDEVNLELNKMASDRIRNNAECAEVQEKIRVASGEVVRDEETLRGLTDDICGVVLQLVILRRRR